jgi:tripartite-type tricarboxylate transporter receptor subunit TctC
MTTRRPLRTVAILLALAMFLTACGADEDPETAADAPADDEAPEETADEDAPEEEPAADDFPDGPLTMVVPWGAGGSSDIAARLFASYMEDELGVQINAINVEGANGAIGWADLAGREPDGYNFGLVTYDVVTNPALGEADYTIDDLDFLMQFETQPMSVYARADRFETMDDLLEEARQNPGGVQW